MLVGAAGVWFWEVVWVMKKFGVQVVAFVGGLALIFGVGWLLFGSDVNRFKEQVAGGKTLAVVVYTGGLCAPTETCEKEHEISGSGSFKEHSSLTGEETARLRELVEGSDLRGLNVVMFDERVCPSHVDGQDVGFKFPTKYGDEVFTLCHLENPLNDPLLKFMVGLVDRHKIY